MRTILNDENRLNTLIQSLLLLKSIIFMFIDFINCFHDFGCRECLYIEWRRNSNVWHDNKSGAGCFMA